MKSTQLLPLILAAAAISGCASYGTVHNAAASPAEGVEGQYSLKAYEQTTQRSDDISMLVAFSGGGTRAAALAYGVLLELRDTGFPAGGSDRRMLDEMDGISSVSGGSFTSAYYGLHGDGIFEDYEEVFLRQDIQGSLISGILRPAQWFKSTGRTEMAVKLYEDKVFKGATFADLKKADGPLILINASDLGFGARFTFIQEYFDLLCSDISSYPVSRAVTASSAVPVLFNPVVVENFKHCKNELPIWLEATKKRLDEEARLEELVTDLESFYQENDRDYIHFVDGGITDNLGLRAIYEIIELSGGAVSMLKKTDREPPSKLVVLSVDASTNPPKVMDATTRQPSTAEVVGAISSIQLHRYNTATISLMQKAIDRWAAEASTPGQTVTPYFIHLGFKDLDESADIAFFNAVPTSFNLSDEQVDRLIQAGRDLLRSNPDFQRLLADLKS